MSSWRQAISNRSTYLVTGGVLVLFVFGLGYVLDPVVQTENLRTLISVMIGAQASVLAIVISVTLISIQLVATRYAPRMATLPFRTPLFKSAFVLFTVSIILDVVLLVQLAPTTSAVYSGFLFVAIGLFFAVLLFLYPFIQGMVSHTSPENLVTLFTETISPDEYLKQSQALAESPEENAHPLQPLFRFIMSALSKSEYGTARSALNQYEQYASEIMRELDEKGIFNDDSFTGRRELFGPVLKEQLHSITIHAAEKDESQVLGSAVNAQVELGKQGMDIGRGIPVPGQAMGGIRNTIIQMPVKSDDYVTFNRAWPAVGELMLEETEYDQHRVLLAGKNRIEGRLPSSLKQSNEPRWHTNALRELFDDLCEAHITVLEKISDGPGFEHIDLRHDPSLREMPAEDLVEQARFSEGAIIEATSTFLNFRINEGDYPATEGNFRRKWRDLCISADSTGAEDQAVYLCQALIEMAFIENSHRPYEQHTPFPNIDTAEASEHLYWVTDLAKIREETTEPIVERAFENILRFEYKEEPRPILAFGIDDEREDQYYYPILSIQGYQSLNTYSQYPELIEELRQEVIQ